jgi:hypothetical protein
MTGVNTARPRLKAVGLPWPNSWVSCSWQARLHALQRFAGARQPHEAFAFELEQRGFRARARHLDVAAAYDTANAVPTTMSWAVAVPIFIAASILIIRAIAHVGPDNISSCGSGA